MSRLKKMFVADEQDGAGLRTSVKASLMEMLVKLSKNNAFNEQGEIRDRSGSFMPGTDVGVLASYAVAPEKIMRGKKQFALLLSESGIPASKVPNENMRKHMPNNEAAEPRPPNPTPPPPPDPPSSVAEPRVISGPPSEASDSTMQLPPPPPLKIMSRPAPLRPEQVPLPESDDDEPATAEKGRKRTKKAARSSDPVKKRVYESFDDSA